jgi:hypothetical protein
MIDNENPLRKQVTPLIACRCGHVKGDHESGCSETMRGRYAMSACGVCDCQQWQPLIHQVEKHRGNQVPEQTISDECRWCGENKPEWSPYDSEKCAYKNCSCHWCKLRAALLKEPL